MTSKDFECKSLGMPLLFRSGYFFLEVLLKFFGIKKERQWLVLLIFALPCGAEVAMILNLVFDAARNIKLMKSKVDINSVFTIFRNFKYICKRKHFAEVIVCFFVV